MSPGQKCLLDEGTHRNITLLSGTDELGYNNNMGELRKKKSLRPYLLFHPLKINEVNKLTCTNY